MERESGGGCASRAWGARSLTHAAAPRPSPLPAHTTDDGFVEPSAPVAKKRPPPPPRRAVAPPPRRRRSSAPLSSSSEEEEEESSSSEDDDDLSEDDDDGRPRAPRGEGGPEEEEEEEEEEEDPAAAELREVEVVLAVRAVPASPTANAAPDAPALLREEFRVKFKGRSHRAAAWVDGALLRAVRRQLTSNFLARRASLTSGDDDEEGAGAEEDDPDLVDGVHPDWTTVERVLGLRRVAAVSPGGPVSASSIEEEALVKWCGLGYASSTWEPVASVDADAVAAYRARQAPTGRTTSAPPPPPPGGWRSADPPPFRNGRALRDYQLEGMRWLAASAAAGRGCILGDEMGLGKV